MRKIIMICSTLISLYSYSQCDVKKKYDKFKDETIYSVDHAKWLSFNKFGTKNDTAIYMYFEAEATSANYSAKGVVILFTDGSKIELPSQKVECKFRAGMMYDYSTFIRLESFEISELKTKVISGIQVYIYDRSFKESRGLKMKEQFNCLLESK